ncbi:MAG: LysM peptidoglycan-binding domain-containing protein [Verrucomicrobia bacterium]|nr:LysM peptidoglycan-binding domain-containing protein [Verrucomicrobiota bacterium]
MRGDIRRLEQDLEALDAEIRRSNDMMRTELAALESSISQLDGKSADRVAAAKQELAGEINKLEERRVADRNALNKKMDWLVDQLKKISGTSSGPSNGAVSEGMRTEKGFEYVIKDGDTVWKIASTFREKYGTTVEAILKANGLDANSIIRPGDTLFIPIRD